MSRQNSASAHSHTSDHSFPFQNDEEDDTATHPTLLPNGILNDDDEDEEDVLPAWPRKQSLGSSSTTKETDAAPQTAILQCRHLPTDLTAREFSGLFTFADGYLDSNLAKASSSSSVERIGTARFNSRQNAAKARAKMQQVPAYAQVEFDISGASSGALEMPTPPATLSTSSKSTGSSGSMQHSRLSSYVKDKTDLQAAAAGISGPSTSTHTALGVEDFYGPSATGPLGGSSLPKGSLGLISSSVPTNFSTSATGTVWSPTSPRFASVTGESLAKSPPAGFSMLPPPQSTKEEDGWARNTARFQSLSLANGGSAGTMDQGRPTAAGALSVLAKGARSPTLSQGFPSIDKSLGSPHLNGNAPSFTKQISSSLQGQGALQQQQQQGFQSGGVAMGFHSPPKQHAMMPSQGHYAPMNPAANGFVVTNRLGPALINTNPADQNPPCNTLYVGNLPLATTEEELKSLFSRQPGYRRLCYRTKSNGPMCFVEFEDVHYAIGALKLLQGVILSSSIKGGIRLSFSKNPLGVRKMDTAAGAGLMSGYAPGHGMQGPGHNGSSASQQHASLQLNGGAHGHGGQHGMGGYAPQAPPGFAAAANGNGHGNGHLHSQGHLVHSHQQHQHHQQQQHSQQGMSMFAPPQPQQSHPSQASVNPVWR